MTESILPRIQVLNSLSRKKFQQALRPLFEGGERLAGILFEQLPYASYEELLGRAESCCHGMSEEEQLEVVNSHPRLGANRASLKKVSQRSFVEQGYDKKDSEQEEKAREELRRLSEEYENTFGFRFVIFVDRRSPKELIVALQQRRTRNRDVELETATEAVFAIARDRLATLRPS